MWKLLSRSTLRERNSLLNIRHSRSTTLVPFSSSNDKLHIQNKQHSHAFSTTKHASANASVAVQLDYYMSIQFAGIANALVTNKYADAGIDNLEFLPTCPVGLEQARVRAHADSNSSATTIGSVEQNIFIPTLHRNPELRTTAVAAMFRQSPLCVASLVDGTGSDGKVASKPTNATIGAHEDTVELIQRIYDSDKGARGENGERIRTNVSVEASPRATKVQDLMNGTYQGIQAYTTTEVPTLNRLLAEANDPRTLLVQPLEGWNGAKLGYSQVLFAPDECLTEGDDRREVVQAFLKASFDGWQNVIQQQTPEESIEQVLEACKMLGLEDETNDHWFRSREFNQDMLRRMNSHLKETFQGDKYGTIDAHRWNEANQWLLHQENDAPTTSKSVNSAKANSKSAASVAVPASFGLDTTGIWKPSDNLLAGNELARTMLEQVNVDSKKFKSKYGRKPKLAVVTVAVRGDEDDGEDDGNGVIGSLQSHQSFLPRYNDAGRRLELYSNTSNSWFSKASTGHAHGISVKEITLDVINSCVVDGTHSFITTDDVLTCLYKLRQDKSIDGIQLMWPLPDHLLQDAAEIYDAIPLEKDVDGVHFVGQCEMMNGNTTTSEGDATAFPPVTPAAVMHLLEENDINLEGKHVLVVGRSRIVGSPMAHLLRQADATVTVAHSATPRALLQKLVGQADVVVSCVGTPGVIPAEWVTAGADGNGNSKVCISVGTTFCQTEDALQSDFGGDMNADGVTYSPVPGGVGPLSCPLLLKQTLEAATRRQKSMATQVISNGWNTTPDTLEKMFWFKDYCTALEFLEKVNTQCAVPMDHHANLKSVTHECIDGIDVCMEYFTYDANAVTPKDYEAAKAVDRIYKKYFHVKK